MIKYDIAINDVRRLNIFSQRYYGEVVEDEIKDIYPSVTEVTSNTEPLPSQLRKWMMSFASEAEYFHALNTTAFYGTLIHLEADNIVRELYQSMGDTYILNLFRNQPKEYADIVLPATIADKKYDMNRYRKDCVALYIWWRDTKEKLLAKYDKVTVVGMETPMVDSEIRVGGTCDLIIKADDTYIIYDFKTGYGHYKQHDLQLNIYKHMLGVNADVSPEKILAFDVHMKGYKAKTLTRYLAGKSKTTPYNEVEVLWNEDWKWNISKYYLDNEIPRLPKNEINTNVTLDKLVEQYKG